MIIINILEASIFTGFVTLYFGLSKKYFIITSLIHFLILTFFAWINNEGVILSIVIVLLMIISVILAKRNISIDYFYIILIYESCLTICNFFGILLLNALMSMNVSQNVVMIIINFFVKILLLIVTYIFLKFRKKISLSLEMNKWSLVILFEILLLSSMAMLTTGLITNEYSFSLLLVLLILLNIMSILFIIIIYRIHLMNMNVVENEKLNQLKKFNEEKMDTIKHIKNEIDLLEHRMIYILLKVKYGIKNEDLESINSLVDSYIDVIAKNKLELDTGNPVFDSIVGLKINDLKHNNVNINFSAFVSENHFFDNLLIVNTIVELLNEFVGVGYLNVQIQQIDENVIIKFIYKNGNISFNNIMNIINHLDKVEYNIDDYEQKGIRLLFRLCDYE